MRQIGIALLVGVLLAINSSPSFAAGNRLRGEWRGEDYDIQLSDTFGQIRGEWGDNEYDLRVSDTFGSVSGDVADGEVDLRYSDTFEHFRGEVPCGEIDLRASTTFGYVRGELCGYDVDIEVDERDAIATMIDLGLEEALSSFPYPTRSAIRRFITRILCSTDS